MTISGKARLAGVMGWPIGHSVSPSFQGRWLEIHGIDGAYVPLAVRPEDLAAAVGLLPRLGFVGFNVTLPHKEAVMAHLNEIEPAARRIGAVNTVVVDVDGRLLGRNTDAFGFVESLKRGAPHWRPARGAAVVIGAGGAARAIVVALADLGVPEIRLVNRTESRARRVAADLGGAIRVIDWRNRNAALTDAGLLVNTTTQGMIGQPPLDLDLAALPLAATVVDIVYVPLETPLLAAAARRGHPTVDGLGMLLHQGRPGFAAWFGVDPAVDDDLRRHVLEAIAHRR